MGWLERWIATTFDYNPTFPLSAGAFMLGLSLLTADGAVDASLPGTLLGLGIVTGYVMALLVVALAVLWPRRIAYETTAILIVFGVVRYAGPFLLAGLAAEGELGAALALGLALTLLMAGMTELVVARVGLVAEPWERLAEVLTFGLATVGFPLLAGWLTAETGASLSHHQARAVELLGWWLLPLLLVPLTLGLDELRLESEPLRSRVPALVWRGLALTALPVLFWNATWVSGPSGGALVFAPLLLAWGAGVFRCCRAAGLETPSWAAHGPALLAAAAVVFGGQEGHVLQGGLDVLPPEQALLAFAPLAAGAVWLIDPTRLREGLLSLAAVGMAAPLALLPSWSQLELYLLTCDVAVLGLALARRDDRLLLWAGAGALLLALQELAGLRLMGQPGVHQAPSLLVLAACLLAGAGVGIGAPRGWTVALARACFVLGVLPGLLSQPPAHQIAFAVAAGGLLTTLAWRTGHRTRAWSTAGLTLAVVLRPAAALVSSVSPGPALVLGAFAALPLGAWAAVRRERAASPLALEERS